MSDEWVMVPRDPTRDMIDAAQNAPGNASYLYHARVYRAMLDAAPAAPQQAEPVGYFQRDCDYFEQVEDVYQWDADVIPLYLHPPAAEVQRLRDAARLALDALTCGYDDDPDGTHRCGRCDSSVDPNSVVRSALRRALEGK